MKQYYTIKGKYPDALLLFRVGDFYETFGEDAVKASKVLGIVLTKRKNGAAAFVDLAGFPHHSLDTYLPKLVRAGYRVAICDQLEDPKLTKKIVKRGVTELVTPGVTLNEHVLDNKSNNFLAAVHFGKSGIGISFLDVSTGEFITSEGNREYAQKLIQGFHPSEVLYQRQFEDQFREVFGNALQTYPMEDWVFQEDYAKEKLLHQFKTLSLKGFGIEDMDQAIIASGAILEYLSNTHHPNLNHISGIGRIQKDDYVWLDQFTIRNLELVSSYHPDGVSLLQVMDHTSSPMGARLLKRWMLFPLKNVDDINQRLEAVGSFIERETEIADLALLLKQVGDLERIISRVAVRKINPRELLHLKKALETVKPIRDFCNASGTHLNAISANLDPNPDLFKLIDYTLHEEAPAQLSKGMVIREGANEELDELRSIAFSGKDHLIQLQEKESKATGIPSLKIGYNNVFGYYLEVRNTHKDKVPEEWIRKQTLTQAERYITPELKEYEQKILGAEEKISNLESKIYTDLLERVQQYIPSVQKTAAAIAKIDCLLSFAKLSIRNNYTRPHLNSGHAINIIDGRHPVIEQNLPLGEKYVANDIYLDDETQQILVITGPNMSGKSALLRQAALIVLMAQMGSYVPAKNADIGFIDRIFTRVGASDNISSGESTFMVEMNETASILNNLSERSLVLLDEIGRGTSTYDGISIAWAITEFIHGQEQNRAKTLFATHYHELNDMAGQFERIKNFNVSVKEVDKKIIFLRKLKPGGSAHSFGIEVAKMAGIPYSIVDRAKTILKHLEKAHRQGALSPVAEENIQLSFIKLDDPALESIKEELLNIDINTLTPVEALLKLNEIKKLVGG